MARTEIINDGASVPRAKETKTIKVLIVDDHKIVREGLRRIIELDDELEAIGEAKNGEEAVSKAVALSPDVILMDLKMPVMDGINATREIKQRLPKVNILILTLYAEDNIGRAIEAGASGYLLKDSDLEQITQGIRQIHSGLSPIDPSLTRNLMTEFAQLSKTSRTTVLSKRETEILRLIADGVNSREISERIFISASTVKRVIRHIFDKLGVSDRAQAVSESIKRNLI